MKRSKFTTVYRMQCRKRQFILFFFFIAFQLQSATPYKTYSVAEGLSNSSVKAICQDSLGYIWLGTKNGLLRFDGYEFRTYYYEAQRKNTAFCNDITCLTIDNRGWIWIGTFNWITLFDPFSEKFVELDLKYPDKKIPDGVVTKIWIDNQDRIWVAAKTGLYVLKDQEIEAVESLKGVCINSMDGYDQDNILIEVMGKGVALFNIRNHSLEYLDESKIGKRTMFYKIIRDTKGRTWFGSNGRNLFLYQPQYKSITPVKIKTPPEVNFDNEYIHDILTFNDSILIFGTDNGLLAINPNTLSYCDKITNVLKTDLLQHNRIMSLYKDNQGALWIGTFNKGVKYYNPNQYYFNHYEPKTDDKSVLSVVGDLVEEKGNLWIGHERGIGTMNLKTGNFSTVDLYAQLATPNEKLEFFFVYKESPELLYFYLLNRGLFKFDSNKRRIIDRVNTPPDSQVRSIAKDVAGNIWIAEENLSVYHPSSGEINSNLSTNFDNITNFMLTQDLLLRHNGNMLVGTRTSGVWEYPYIEQAPTQYGHAHKIEIEQLRNKNVNVLFEDSRHNVWVGTYGSGLFRCNLEKNECELFEVNNGLVHNSICGILEDEANGDIWVAALNGISKINPESGKIINYTGKTGFPLEEVSRKAFLKGSDGLFYIGGSNGLVSFDPNTFKDGFSKPPVARISLIKSLNAQNDSQQSSFDNYVDMNKVEFTYNHSSIITQFSALNYSYPQGSQYAYKLEGSDQDWKYTEQNEAVYSNLPDGKYTFYVKARNNDGVWSEDVTSVKFVIHPPFWLSIWAKMVYLLVISGLFYFVVQFFYNKKTTKYRQQINRIEKENIEKYYQMKLELFTKFSHELRTPLTLIIGPTEDLLNEQSIPEKLLYPVRLIYKNANRLLLLVNQLMDFRKMEHGAMILNVRQVEINTFLLEQIESFSDLANKKNVKLSYLNQYWEKDVWFDTELMEKVIFNLLSNAVKHTHKGGEIIVTSKKEEENLIISVRDTGDGIAPENLEKIFNPFFQVEQQNRSNMFGSGIGLNLAKYVVTLHGGKIWVESTVGKGSEFFVLLYPGVDHYDKSHTEIVTETDDDNQSRLLEKNSMLTIEVDDKVEKDEKAESENRTWLLIAEDDDDLRRYIISNLSNEYAIIEAADGKEALAKSLEKLPDLIISDVMMPAMSGIEYCKRIKEDIKTAHIPVILLTARTMDEYIQEGYEALADDYILKPFNAGLLKIRIKNLIDNRNQLRQVFSSQLMTSKVPVVEVVALDPFMEKLFEIVQKRIDDSELSINEISTEMGVSRAQFFRKIKAVSDISPNKIILNIRMKMAADFLRSKQYNIAEVAYRVGFLDPAYFSKAFKLVFNITPSDFIKSISNP